MQILWHPVLANPSLQTAVSTTMICFSAYRTCNDNTCRLSHSSVSLDAISHPSDLCNAKETLKYAYANVFLYFYINSQWQCRRGVGCPPTPLQGEGVALILFFFNNLHFTHALAWKAEWVWRQRSLNKWSVYTSVSVWQCDRSIEIWIGMSGEGRANGETNARNECVWCTHRANRHLPKTIPLRHHIFDSCTNKFVSVCVQIYGVLENCARRTRKVCQKICSSTCRKATAPAPAAATKTPKQIYMRRQRRRRRSPCINVLLSAKVSKSFQRVKEQRDCLEEQSSAAERRATKQGNESERTYRSRCLASRLAGWPSIETRARGC